MFAQASSMSPPETGDGKLFSAYEVEEFFDEMFGEDGQTRPSCSALYQGMSQFSGDELARRQHAARQAMVQLGVRFNVYGDEQGTERFFRSISCRGISTPRSGTSWIAGSSSAHRTSNLNRSL